MEAGTIFWRNGNELVSRIPDSHLNRFALSGGASGELREWPSKEDYAVKGEWPGWNCDFSASRAPIIVPQGQTHIASNIIAPKLKIQRANKAVYVAQWKH